MKTTEQDSAELRQIFASNVRKFRLELNLTKETLAEKADISVSCLVDIERCRSWVSDKTLVKLAAALYKKPFELLLPDENNTSNIENQLANIIYEQRKEVLKQTEKLFDETLQKVLFR